MLTLINGRSSHIVSPPTSLLNFFWQQAVPGRGSSKVFKLRCNSFTPHTVWRSHRLLFRNQEAQLFQKFGFLVLFAVFLKSVKKIELRTCQQCHSLTSPHFSDDLLQSVISAPWIFSFLLKS